jgi:hypothetical protein
MTIGDKIIIDVPMGSQNTIRATNVGGKYVQRCNQRWIFQLKIDKALHKKITKRF